MSINNQALSSNRLKIWLWLVAGLIILAGLAFGLSWKAHWDVYNPKQYKLEDSSVKSSYDQLIAADKTLKSGFDFNAAISRANALRALGKQSAELRAWQYFILNRPSAIQGYWGLAQIYTAQKKYRLAETNWLKAIEVDKPASYASSYLGLADLYKNWLPTERYKLVQIMTDAIALNSKEANYPMILANYYEDTSDFTSALRFYRQAYQLDPKGGAHLLAKIAELTTKTK